MHVSVELACRRSSGLQSCRYSHTAQHCGAQACMPFLAATAGSIPTAALSAFPKTQEGVLD